MRSLRQDDPEVEAMNDEKRDQGAQILREGENLRYPSLLIGPTGEIRRIGPEVKVDKDRKLDRRAHIRHIREKERMYLRGIIKGPHRDTLGATVRNGKERDHIDQAMDTTS